MDISTFNRAKAAYDAKDWETAALLFSACTDGPGASEACHLRGNALMRLGRVQEAIAAYRQAAADPSYANQGAVYTNLGKAQAALGDYRGAVASLRQALEDPNYAGAYKALLALGSAYSKLGDARNAGVAYRKAALEENNPDPAKALINLGVCFVQLRRPADAAEAYRTALDFSQDANERNMIQSNLGQAYVASNRMSEAVQAFTAAVAGGYQLLPPAQADFDRAREAMGQVARSGRVGSSTSDFLAAYGTDGAGVDPLDPMGRTGDVMPSPDESGFFDISDEEIEQASKSSRKAAREAERASGGRTHVGVKIALVILLIVLIILGAGIALYFQGYGVPSQQTTVDGFFTAVADGADTTSYWATDVPAQTRSEALAEIASGSSHEIEGMDVTGQESVALVRVSLDQGADYLYRVSLVREGFGWKISDAHVEHTSLTEATFDQATAEPPAAVAVPETTDQAAEDQAAVDATAEAGTEGGEAGTEEAVGEGTAEGEPVAA